MGVDHLGDAGLRQEVAKLRAEVRALATATLQNSAIGRAGLRVYDGGWVRIEDGGLSVTGTASVSGTLTGSGLFDWTGPVNLKGAQSVTGPTTFTGQLTVVGPWSLDGNGLISGDVDITGDVDVSGSMSITGDVDLSGDMDVVGGGRIRAGQIVIDPSTSGGQVQIGSHRLYVNGAVLTLLHSSGAQVVLNNSGASLTYPGGVLTVDSGGVYASLNTISLSSAPSGAFVGAVVSVGGYLRRVVA